jgi:hypothetical protein
MSIHLVTFSDESMSLSAQFCIDSAKRSGINIHSRFNAGNIAHWDLTADTVKQHAGIFTQPLDPRRAFAYWAWKPLIIEASLRELSEDSTLIYSDAGIEFIAPVFHIIERMDQDVFLFGNNWQHSHWCKRDVVDEVWPDYRMGTVKTEDDYRYRSEQMWSRFGKQCQASVIFFRVSDYTRRFIAEWLKWCLFEGGRLIDDSPSRAPNHPEFQEHRHDQSILTTMAYRDGLTLHYWPASYNDGAFVYEKLPEYASDSYPILFNHHRRRNHEWPTEDLTGNGHHAFHAGRGSNAT